MGPPHSAWLFSNYLLLIWYNLVDIGHPSGNLDLDVGNEELLCNPQILFSGVR